MSLFKWSTPDRRRGDEILLIIPNEIYLDIFEYIAPPTGSLSPEQLQTFTNLSCVCRFFANVCLPRIFEFVEISGSVFTPSTLHKDSAYKSSRGSTLCAQIAAKQPLALALAQKVEVCHFTNWKLEDKGSWAVKIFAHKYITGMVHMKNIHKLTFSNSHVDSEHWDAIATLKSLQDLTFDRCHFLRGPADVKPDKRVKLKLSRLQVTKCAGHRQPLAAVETRGLRALVIDFVPSEHFDWSSHSTLTELHICPEHSWRPDVNYADMLHDMVAQVPQSVEVLCFSLGAGYEHIVRGTLKLSPWRKNLPLLRSLTLKVRCRSSDIPFVLSLVLEGINCLTALQNLILEDPKELIQSRQEISVSILEEVRRILDEKLGSASRLSHADVCGEVFRLVDGVWAHVL